MVERKVDLKRTPDRTPQPLSLTTERLGLAFQARQDFARALDIAGSITADASRAYPLIHIGRAQVRSGIDPSPSLTGLTQLAEEPGQIYHQIIHEGIAKVHIEAGDFESAQDVLNRAPRLPLERRFYFELARAKAKHGQDPSPELSRVRAEIEDYETQYLSSGINSYAELAEAHYQATGEYPEGYLSRAEANIEAYGREYPEAIHLPGWYGDISRAYATAGNFERARALVDKIKGYNPISEAQTRMRALQHIAQEQVARGLHQDAIANAHLAIQTFEQAEVKQEHLRAHIEHDQTVGVIKLLALIAKAQGLSGEDSSETLGTALERVNQIPHNGYWKMDVLVEIARAQRQIGIDVTPTLARALAELDDMPQAADYDNYYDLAQQVMGYEELAKVQAEFGQIDEARVILSRLENFNADDPDIKGMVAEVLADIAETEAKQGLTPDELTTLSQEEIQAILQGNNELAKQSARHFGLDKKVA